MNSLTCVIGAGFSRTVLQCSGVSVRRCPRLPSSLILSCLAVSLPSPCAPIHCPSPSLSPLPRSVEENLDDTLTEVCPLSDLIPFVSPFSPQSWTERCVCGAFARKEEKLGANALPPNTGATRCPDPPKRLTSETAQCVAGNCRCTCLRGVLSSKWWCLHDANEIFSKNQCMK